jgi:uncharacterized protein YndB with AHSA1/START domain
MMIPTKHGTVALERVFPAPPERVFAALSTKAALVEWGAPSGGWSLSYDRFDFRIGHTDIATFGPFDGEPYVNETTYLAIEPDRRIVSLSTIAHHGLLLFAGILTMELEAAGNGTLLRLNETGAYLDENDDPEGHEAGWIEMLGGLGAWLKRNRQVA